MQRLGSERRWIMILVAVLTAASVASIPPAAATGGDPEPKAPTGTTGEAPPSESARQLLPYIPTDQRYSCESFDPTPADTPDEVVAEAAAIDAAVFCDPDGPAAAISYYLFADAAAMNRAYSTLIGSLAPSGDPACEGDSPWTFNDETTGGRIVCYIGTRNSTGEIAGTAALVWTSDEANILGYTSAEIGDADAAGLREWWNESAGPKRHPDDSDLATPSNRPAEAAEAEILRRIPKATRRSCTAADRKDPDSIGPSLFENRFFIQAAVICKRSDPAVDQLSYAKIDPEIIEAYADQVFGFTDEQLDAVDDTDEDRCPIQSTYSIGKGKKERELGTYACYFLDNDDGTRRVVWRWTDTELGILGIATNNAGDADALEEWWTSNRSGPIQP